LWNSAIAVEFVLLGKVRRSLSVKFDLRFGFRIIGLAFVTIAQETLGAVAFIVGIFGRQALALANGIVGAGILVYATAGITRTPKAGMAHGRSFPLGMCSIGTTLFRGRASGTRRATGRIKGSLPWSANLTGHHGPKSIVRGFRQRRLVLSHSRTETFIGTNGVDAE
jgi:hypothetical protein